MKAMFRKNKKITSLPTSFDTSNVTTMESMFEDSVIRSLPWFNTSSVTIMSKMFYKSKNFNQDISGWDVGNVNITYWYSYEIKNWYWFNKDSSLKDRNIPKKFRED
jgi:surface protein